MGRSIARRGLRAGVVLGAAVAFAGGGLGAIAACDGDGAAASVGEVDPGPTFGLEVTAIVKGAGRIRSDLGGIDCPGACFARLTSTEHTFDSSDLGFALYAAPSLGWHFAGWSTEIVPLGTRARGPAECSPMTRFTIAPSIDVGNPELRLPFGETEGTPPRGRAEACAAYTTVPVAYALTATFEEDGARPGPPPTGTDPVEVLFEPPLLGTVSSHEIAVRDGRVYYRYDRDGLGGIAVGAADGSSGGTKIVVANVQFQVVDFSSRSISFQSATSRFIETLEPGTDVRRSLPFVSFCGVLASDDQNVYCRTAPAFVGATTSLYAISRTGTYQFLYALPEGLDLAVDADRVYFSNARTSGDDPSSAGILSAPRVVDAGTPLESALLFTGQTLPMQLRVDGSRLYWVDRSSSATMAVVSGPKAGGIASVALGLPGAATIALDPAVPGQVWMVFRGAVGGTQDGSTIYVVDTASPGQPLQVFLTGLPGINGIAVDATHVYWTQDDGRVYRAARTR